MIKPLYYFAYGSNMLTARLEWRIGRLGVCEKLRNHTLGGFNLVFNCGWKRNSYANIVEEPVSKVEGILWKLDDYQIHELDKFECYPYNYEKRYFDIPEGLGFAYVSVNPFFASEALPEWDYLKTLIKGAKEHNLRFTYRKLLEYAETHYK